MIHLSYFLCMLVVSIKVIFLYKCFSTVDETILFCPWSNLKFLLKISSLDTWESMFLGSPLLHLSLCLPLCQYHNIFITIVFLSRSSIFPFSVFPVVLHIISSSPLPSWKNGTYLYQLFNSHSSVTKFLFFLGLFWSVTFSPGYESYFTHFLHAWFFWIRCQA